MIHVVGGGLAGSEAAWQVASSGVAVTLHEMRPVRATPVHRTDRLAELVCSNSFRSDKLDNAVGLLKEELRRLGSIVMRAADATRVPAGAALAVDRHRFAETVTTAVSAHPLVTIVRHEVDDLLPQSAGRNPVVIATGPLTSDRLSERIAEWIGQDNLHFYDAISPIVLAETIDLARTFRASRWDRSLSDRSTPGGLSTRVICGTEAGRGDYINCPLTVEQYERFYDALMHAQPATVHDPDSTRYFEGCLPIEVLARRGRDTLRFGPMKPVGLVDPETGRRPYAVVQLRQDTLAGDHYSLVGFQTQLRWSEQVRVLRLIPALESAEFVRFGMVHRNTYINAPAVLRETWQTRTREDLFFAGQISGVEGYVESTASGLVAGLCVSALAQGRPLPVPPRTTAVGALCHYVSHANPIDYQPSNVTFGIIQPSEAPPRGRFARNLAISEHALADLSQWMTSIGTKDASAARLAAGA